MCSFECLSSQRRLTVPFADKKKLIKRPFPLQNVVALMNKRESACRLNLAGSPLWGSVCVWFLPAKAGSCVHVHVKAVAVSEAVFA